MLHIFAYALGIMYTPGPVNILAFSQGLGGYAPQIRGFCAGVGCAMFALFVLLGYSGQMLVGPAVLPYISMAGCAYIALLGWKIWNIRPQRADNGADATTPVHLSFRDGLFMQLLNPKAFIATLPIATIQFPAAQITGIGIAVFSAVLACMAFGAPTTYSLLGARLGKRLENASFMHRANKAMALLLFYVAVSMAYEQVYLPFTA